jgi:hypothetical protein
MMPHGSRSLAQYHQGFERVTEALSMGVDLSHDQVMFLLHR